MEHTAIIGIGMTTIERQKPRDTFADMVWEAVTRALADAGIGFDDIDNVITTSNDFWDGRTISCMAVSDASGARHKNVSCVEGDGTFGAFYGLCRILSGAYGTILVTAHSKGSESVSSLITNAAFDPLTDRALGLDALTAAAIQANIYMHHTGTTPEEAALVPVKNHGNARHNPHAQLPMEITVQDVLASEMIADPLHRLDCSPVSDGACALVLASESRARKTHRKPVWVKGVAFCSDAYYLGDRNLAEAPALKEAARKAYAQAGISNPAQDIQVAEVYDAFGFQELMWIEAMGLCGTERAGKLLAGGRFGIRDRLAVNPSGGLLSGHPVIAAGLIRMAEVVRQLRGEAGAYQVDDVRMGVAHGINGVCGQSHCVWVLGSEQ